MDVKEFPSEDPNTRGWVTTGGTKIACRRTPESYLERNFHMEARFLVGTKDELPVRLGGEDKEGVAHTGEHTPYLGTESYPGSWAVPRLIESKNGEWNATTGRDETNYWLHLPKDEAALAAQIIGELIRNPNPDPNVLQRELRIIDTERATISEEGNDFRKLWQAVIGDNPFGYNIVGTKESIASTTLNDIIKFRNKNYRSGRLALALEGDLPHEHMLELALKTLDVAQKGGQLQPGITQQPGDIPAYSGTVLLDERRDSESTTQTICFFNPEAGRGLFTDMQHMVAWGLFHDGSDAFSLNKLRVDKGLHYGHEAFSAFTRNHGLCGVTYKTLPENAKQVRELLANELNAFGSNQQFYRQRLELIASQQIYRITDWHRRSPFYGTSELTRHLLYENAVPPRTYGIENFRRLNYDHMVEAVENLRSNPPSIRLRGALADRPDYDQICEVFSAPSSVPRRAANALTVRAAHPDGKKLG
ncbi:MAG: M16 family metallopeptidase [Bdellovibrionales bacterium]